MKIFKGVVRILGGALARGNKGLDTLREALTEEARCGCGIDCCDNRIVIPDKQDGKVYELVVINGVLHIGEKDSGTHTPV